jgi:hypothetical protein
MGKSDIDSSLYLLVFAKTHKTQGASPLPAAILPPVSTTPAANFATSFASVVDTNDKFSPGVNKPVAICHQYQRPRRQICPTGVKDTDCK